jgi:hypothetical protein
MVILSCTLCEYPRISAFGSRSMSTWNRMDWEDIADLADRAFWGVGLGTDWAQMMWPYLTKAGLTRYRTEIERCQVKIYAMALADFYHQFFWVACQEPQDEEYCDWAEALELSEFRIGQLMGADPDFEPDETRGYSLTQVALRYLIEDARTKLMPVMSEFPGGALSLMQTLMYYSRDYSDDDAIQSPQDIFVEVSDRNMATFHWIESEISPSKTKITNTSPNQSNSPTAAHSGDVQLCLSDLP